MWLIFLKGNIISLESGDMEKGSSERSLEYDALEKPLWEMRVKVTQKKLKDWEVMEIAKLRWRPWKWGQPAELCGLCDRVLAPP